LHTYNCTVVPSAGFAPATSAHFAARPVTGPLDEPPPPPWVPLQVNVTDVRAGNGYTKDWLPQLTRTDCAPPVVL
jgi:hypothetical protein